MAADKTKPFRNFLLNALSLADRDALARDLTSVDLPRRAQLELPNKKIEHVYFIETGIASVVASSGPGAPVEVGIIGHEGMSGLPVVHLADRVPYAVYMQVAGSAQRVAANAVRDLMARSLESRRVFLAFAQGFLIQTAETAVANARATLTERLARWLLMAQDRVEGDEIHLTHEFLSMMMGARRPGVTEAMNELERLDLVATRRGAIMVVSRKGLETRAGKFYGLPERELARLLANR